MTTDAGNRLGQDAAATTTQNGTRNVTRPVGHTTVAPRPQPAPPRTAPPAPATAPPERTPSGGAQRAGGNNWIIPLGVLIIGMFMSVLDTSIVNVAIPKMQVALNATADDIEWVVTGYTLVLGMGALTPDLGHAESGHGRGSEMIHDHGPQELHR